MMIPSGGAILRILCVGSVMIHALGMATGSDKLDSPSVAISRVHTVQQQQLPYFMVGEPEDQTQHRFYHKDAQSAPHTVGGKGLWTANTGTSTSFLIKLVEDATPADGEDGTCSSLSWNVKYGCLIYVSMISDGQMFAAEVVNNMDGTLTATYTSDFPGQYFVYIEEIDMSRSRLQRARYFKGSPYNLTISGDVTLDVDNLPSCNEVDASGYDDFWRLGTWLSSREASAEHGTLRNGWVFQPKQCVHETYSYDDLMVLAALEEPTWIVILGGSVQRGIYESLIDMLLAQGQKDYLGPSDVGKCWGWADVTFGNLRVTYQDMRLWTITSTTDMIVCDDEKLASGGTTEYVRSAKELLRNEIFKEDGSAWPDLVVAPAFMYGGDDDYLFTVEVPMEALPSNWKGELWFLEHMTAYGDFHWYPRNPTATALGDCYPSYHKKKFDEEVFLRRMERFREADPRVSFTSTIPMAQANLWENEKMVKKEGTCYGCSQHFHYVMLATDSRSYEGSKMVNSMTTEMLANMAISKVVGTRESLYRRAKDVPDLGHRVAAARAAFEVCVDCPASLVPFHVKAEPKPTCNRVNSMSSRSGDQEVWNKDLCPSWCLATDPVSETPTESGPVQVRECPSLRPDHH